MHLYNFEEDINPIILERGRSYFENFAVTEIENIGGGSWEAIVNGTEYYDVELVIDEETEAINDYGCNCPYDGVICKHVVAALFAVQEIRETPQGKAPVKSKREVVAEIIQGISAEELRAFVLEYAKTDKNFRLEIELRFMDKITDSSKYEQEYRRLVLEIIKRNDNLDYDNLDYEEEENLEFFQDEMLSLLESGDRLLEKKNIPAVFAMAKVVILEIGGLPVAHTATDRVLTDACAMLEGISRLNNEADDKQIFTFLRQEVCKPRYLEYDDAFYAMLDLVAQLAAKYNSYAQYIEIIDRVIALAENENNYMYGTLIELKLSFLQNTGRTVEAEKLVAANMHIDRIRRRKVNDLIEQEKYAEAIVIINESIESEKQRYPNNESAEWKRELLKIAELQNDIDQIRTLSKFFTFFGSFHIAYYRQWKATFLPDEWAEEVKLLLAKYEKAISQNPGRFNMAYFPPSYYEILCAIFLEEQMWDKLWNFLKEHPNFTLLKNYHTPFAESHPKELTDLYLVVFTEMAEMANKRSAYEQWVADAYAVAKLLPYTLPHFKQLAHKLIPKYLRRRAMVEVFTSFINS